MVEVKDGGNTVQAYEYDGLNQRIVKDVNGGDTFDYYYNDEWQVLEERKDADPDPLSQYVWHPYYIDALAVRYYDENTDNSGIVRHWYLQDANFNVTAIVNDSAAVLERYHYTPYGEVTFLEPDFDPIVGNASAIGNNILYTGRERDPETGLQLNRERWYHAGLGRWLTRDPMEYWDGTTLYAYVHNNPINNTDPSGLKYYPIKPPINTGRSCASLGLSEGDEIEAQIGGDLTLTRTRQYAEECIAYDLCKGRTRGYRVCTETFTFVIPKGTRAKYKCIKTKIGDVEIVDLHLIEIWDDDGKVRGKSRTKCGSCNAFPDTAIS